jgi:hypothetical protein
MTVRKIALIVAGYLLAIMAAAAVVWVNSRFASAVDQRASGGMMAFGDAVLFLVALVAFSLPATGAAAWLLLGSFPRQNPADGRARVVHPNVDE